MRTTLAAASFAVVLAALSLADRAVAENLVVNGGFETNPPAFDGWTVIYGGTGGLFLDSLFPHSGAFAAAFNATRGEHDSLEQLLPTTPGMIYEVSFWLTHPIDTPPDNDFTVSWDGTPFVSLVDVPPLLPYTEYTFTAQAAGLQSALRFTGRDQPAALILDDVSVVVIPEPSSSLLFALGAVALAAFRRRLKR